MDYKDKLRLAKEALDSGSYDKETIEYIFPELKESEDKRIRKEIIAFLTYYHTGQGNSVKYDDGWIAWLEKQGEQKPVDLVAMMKDYFANTPKEQQEKDWAELKHLNDVGFGIEIPFGAKDSELQEVSYYIPEGFHAEIESNRVVIKRGRAKPAWSDDFEEEMDRYIEENFYGSADNGFFSNRTKRELEAEDVVRIGCHFAAWQKEQSNKELSDKSKQEWSEEDAEQLDFCCAAIEMSDFSNVDYRTQAATWLKSLKERVQPQNRWKPSERQIYLLNWVANILLKDDGIVEKETAKELQQLLEQLKKLRGE